MQIPITQFFQSLGAWLLPFMQAVSALQYEMFSLIIMTSLYWCFNSALGIRVGVALLSATSLNSWLKMAFHGARPYWVSDKVIGYAHEVEFGLPSGHAMYSTIVWGRIAAWVKKAWVWVVCIILILLIGISRIYLGVHFSSDVIAGWVIGAIFLILFILLEKPVSKLWLSRKFSTQIILAFLISCAMIGIDLLFIKSVAVSNIPAEWSTTATANLAKGGVDIESLDLNESTNVLDLKDSMVTGNYENSFSRAGLFFGMIIGISMLKKLGGFIVAKNSWHKLLSYFVGLVGILVFYIGLGSILKFLLPDPFSILSMYMRYFRYILIGLWVSLVAPLLFIKFGWASNAIASEVVKSTKTQKMELNKRSKKTGGKK